MKVNMSYTILGVFLDKVRADRAIAELKNESFDPKNISIVIKDTSVSSLGEDSSKPIIEGAVGGAMTGGTLAGIAGLLTAIGAIAVPGIGALFIGGPLAAALGLTGAAAATTIAAATSGVVAGGLVGALVGMGVPEEVAKVYETELKEGAVVLAVAVNDESSDDAKHIFEKNGATQIRTITNIKNAIV